MFDINIIGGVVNFESCPTMYFCHGLKTPSSTIKATISNSIIYDSPYAASSFAGDIINSSLPKRDFSHFSAVTYYGLVNGCRYDYTSSIQAPSGIVVYGMMTNCRFNGPAIGTYPKVQDGGVILNCYDGGGKAINIFS